MTKRKLTFIILISFYMMLLMGTVYAYSIFRTDIKEIYQVNTLLSGLPYMLSLSFYALAMMVTGRYINNKNLRQIVFLGSMMIVLGFFVSSVTHNFIIFTLSYGMLIGIGVGMVYGIPVYIMQRYFPKRSGLYTGIILLGFGLSPLITAPLGKLFLSIYNLNTTFLILSIIFLITQVPLSLFFKINEETLIESKNNKPSLVINQNFWIIYGLFTITTAIGLMMIGLSYQVGVNYYGFDSKFVMLSISIFALCNGIARPMFGYLIDKYDIIKPSIASLVLIGLAAGIGIFNQGSNFYFFALTYGLFWFNLGAWLSIMPSMIKKYFDINHYSKIYGLVFTAYGIGAILSTLISGSILDILGKTTYIYVSILVLLILAFILISRLKSVCKGVNY
ncbi:MFS transporter [Mariniplasma anaerobium]|uniref:MFS transporter n=1 Tax=Mariniplasma anaerobium TaxID=2735436 RepID=A0A7U9TIQ0_9MOLU|nr:MFS transporter [Mariniplasma anaerobium]BCR36387.1 MFS transporter [Mariniplasma anaerobium]